MKQNVFISLIAVLILHSASNTTFSQTAFVRQPLKSVTVTIPDTSEGNTLTAGESLKRSYYKSSVIVAGLFPGIRYSFNSGIGIFADISFAMGINNTKMYGGGILVRIKPRTFINAGLKMGKHHFADANRTINEFYFRPELSLQTQFKRLTILYGLELFGRNTKDTNLGNVSDKVRLPLPVLGLGFNF